MSKHTPAPWTTISNPYEDGKPYYYISAGRGFHGEGFSFSGIIPDADARLIAAAPDLLAALEGMIALWSEHDAARLSGLIDCGGLNEEHRLATLNARAAIAKAKGETP
jgi:hypothetical protein